MTDSPPARLRLGMVGGGRGALIGETHPVAARLDDRYALVADAIAPIVSGRSNRAANGCAVKHEDRRKTETQRSLGARTDGRAQGNPIRGVDSGTQPGQPYDMISPTRSKSHRGVQ
jgi:hypothetical protein